MLTCFELPINNLDGNFMKFSFRGYMNNVYERIWLDNITVKEKQIDGIESIEALAPSVVATKGGIAVNGVLGQVVNIYSIDGKLIDSFNATGYQTRSLAPGIYIVTVAGNTHKIRVS